MTFRLLRLFFLRFLPRRLFAVVTLIEFAMLARRLYRAAAIPGKPAPRVVGRSGFDDDPVEVIEPRRRA